MSYTEEADQGDEWVVEWDHGSFTEYPQEEHETRREMLRGRGRLLGSC